MILWRVCDFGNMSVGDSGREIVVDEALAGVRGGEDFQGTVWSLDAPFEMSLVEELLGEDIHGN